MKIAIVGSRNITTNIESYIPPEMTVLISGGAIGVDAQAEQYADTHHIPKLIFIPDYRRHGRVAPLLRNEAIVEIADLVIAIWDGKSLGTKYTIDYAKRVGKSIKIVEFDTEND